MTHVPVAAIAAAIADCRFLASLCVAASAPPSNKNISECALFMCTFAGEYA